MRDTCMIFDYSSDQTQSHDSCTFTDWLNARAVGKKPTIRFTAVSYIIYHISVKYSLMVTWRF